MGPADAARRAALELLEAPADPVATAYDRIGQGPARAVAPQQQRARIKPKQRGRTGSASSDALHPHVAKGRVGGGQFADKAGAGNDAPAGGGADGRQEYQLGSRAAAQHEVDQALATANKKPKAAGAHSRSRSRRNGTTKGAPGWQGKLGAGLVKHGDGMDRSGGDGMVKQVQAKLEAFGYDLGDAGVDGRFGGATKAAVRKLQAHYGLKADGIVGARTKALLDLMTSHEQARTKGGLSIDQEKLSEAARVSFGALAMHLAECAYGSKP